LLKEFKECAKVVKFDVMSNNYNSPNLAVKSVVRVPLLFTVVEAITVLPPKFVSTR